MIEVSNTINGFTLEATAEGVVVVTFEQALERLGRREALSISKAMLLALSPELKSRGYQLMLSHDKLHDDPVLQSLTCGVEVINPRDGNSFPQQEHLEMHLANAIASKHDELHGLTQGSSHQPSQVPLDILKKYKGMVITEELLAEMEREALSASKGQSHT